MIGMFSLKVFVLHEIIELVVSLLVELCVIHFPKTNCNFFFLHPLLPDSSEESLTNYHLIP